MTTERLYVHRVELVRDGNSARFEPLPLNPEQENLGIRYRLSILKSDANHATCYGWDTGYAGCGFDEASWPTAEVYAPKGFSKGNLVFVTAKDTMLAVSTRELSSVAEFLANLEEVNLEATIAKLQGFSFAGIIEH